MVLGSRGRHGRRDELEPGPVGEVGPFLEKLVPGDDPGPGGDLLPEGAGDERVPGGVVADRRVGAPRPDDDAAAGVREVEDVEAELPADPVEPRGDPVEVRFPEGLPEELLRGAEPDGVAEAVQPLLIDHPGRGQVVPDLGLGQRDDGLVLDPRADDEGQDAADDDDGEKTQDELAPQGQVEEPSDESVGWASVRLGSQ